MPRKRKGVPQKVDEDKRQCLSWNMYDDFNVNNNDTQNGEISQQSTSQEEIGPRPMVVDTSLVETVENSIHTAENSQSKGPILNLENAISQLEYNKIWDAADYSINVHNTLKVKQGEWTGKLGEFHVKLGPFLSEEEPEKKWTAPKHLPDDDKFSLFINNDKNLHYLIYDCHSNNNENLNNAVSNDIYSCFRMQVEIPKSRYLDDIEYLHRYASGRLLRVVKSQYNQAESEVTFDIYILKSFLSKLKFQCQPGNSGKLQYHHLQGLMEWFYRVPVYALEDGRKGPLQDINVLFDNVRDHHANETRLQGVDPQHPSLLPKLRPYQSHGVLWMLEREHHGKDDTAGESGQEIHPLWREIQTRDDKILYFNIYSGEIVLEKPTRLTEHPGGILADEMGLGKTVEVLACMLLHPRTDLPPVHYHANMETNKQAEDGSSADDCKGDQEARSSKSKDNEKTEEKADHSNTALQDKENSMSETSTIVDTDPSSKRNSKIETPSADQEAGSGYSPFKNDSQADTHTNADSSREIDRTDTGVRGDIDDVMVNNQSVRGKDSVNNSQISCSTEHSSVIAVDAQQVNQKSITNERQSNGSENGKFRENLENVDCKANTDIVKSLKPKDVSGESQKDTIVGNKEKQVLNGQQGKDNQGMTSQENDNQDSNCCPRSTASSDGSSAGTDSEDPHHNHCVSKENMHTSSTVDGERQKSSAGDLMSQVKSTGCHDNSNYDTSDGTKQDQCMGVDSGNIGHGDCDNKNATDRTVHKNLAGDEEDQVSQCAMGEKEQSGCMEVESQKPHCMVDNNQKSDDVEDGSQENEVLVEGSRDDNSSMEVVCQTPQNISEVKQRAADTVMTNPDTAPSRTDDKPEKLPEQPVKKKTSYWSRLASKAKVQFQCICGIQDVDKEKDTKLRVKCSKCGLWQHAQCVNYDFADESIKYFCPHCQVAMPPLPSCATLIISPTSICHQWVDEINRHIKTATLKVLVYQGVKKHSFMQPYVLAGYDIVITTYETLRNEINYVDLPHSNSDEGRRFRHAKRYMAVPSPITAVQWWRVCLDEAQMVECATTKAAEMALRLSAVNRWCVTGTPIQKGMEDLYGLFLFLGLDPYWVKYWWNKLLYQPYLNGNPKPVNEAVAKVLWRTAKKDVLDQINIPSQTEQIHWLNFSPVEKHFYRRKHEDCAQDVIRVLNKWPQEPDTKLNQLDRQVVHAMMWPLLRLRQACCHPQAVRGEFIPLNKSTMTMEELLKSLTQKTKLECEEAHRQLICALNGLAALHIIKEEYVEAAEKYREVFRSVEEHKGQLKTDSLQRLHALHNLHELLSQNHPGIDPTLRDSQLKNEAEDIKSTYMTKANAVVLQAEQNLLPVQEKISELRNKFKDGSEWWVDGITWSMYTYQDDELVQRIKEELESKASTDTMSIVNKFRDGRGLQYVLTSHLEKLQESHAKLLQTLHDLGGDVTPVMLNSVIECHLRPFKGIVKKDCVFCQADDTFSDYETKLFSMQTRNLQELVIEEEDGDTLVMGQGSRTKGTWAVGEIERTMKQILSFMKLRHYDENQIQYGNVHMELFENLRKEFKCLRSVWMALHDRVAAMDELEMTTMRLRLLLPDEPHDPDSQPYIVEPGKFDLTRLKHLSDKVIATSELRKKLGQLLYLTNLAKVQDGCQDGCNPEPCPICDKQLGTQWSVLHCGHCFCNDCMDILVRQYSVGGRRGATKCAICRQRTPVREISYVSTDPSSHLDEEDRNINVKGSHSTKVEAVVRTLRKIQQNEPGAKSLVFSTWLDVLDVIAQALKENNSEFRYITNAGHRHFQAHLLDFKYNDSVTTLLLPVHCGSHGLNIVEATHVLLVEPIINPASELQAVGRVHRIGQTKATVVHRFLVRNTIEDRIHAMLKPIHSRATLDTTQSDAAILTVRDLRLLFSQEENDDDEELDQLPPS
ncbi:E3 ubiquitin-protein ligase SHPRH-like [Ptychodera flava]|uniref:E3 ubiquitin-protein ligase SHPRH-like n=1 Tax=Ptychodera flava TaxID=63121 RepID=UPI003969E3E4